MIRHSIFFLIGVVAVSALTCPGICPNDTTMGLPDRAYNWSALSDTISCAEWDQDTRTSYVNDQGQEVCTADDDQGFWIDMASYCGCEGYTQPLSCDFCPSGKLINPDTMIEAPEGSDLEISLTCEQASVATQFVSNEITCLSLKLLFAPSCCQEEEPDVSPANSTSTSPCSICPTGSSMQNPDKSLFFIGEGLTCQKGQDILDNLETEAECSQARERFDRLPLDVAAWCECSGVEPPNACALCSRTPEGVMENGDREVDLGNNLTVTCSGAEELSKFITNTNVCAQQYETAIGDCCSGVPTAPTPAIVLTPAPTFVTSGSARRQALHLWLGIASMVLLGSRLISS